MRHHRHHRLGLSNTLRVRRRSGISVTLDIKGAEYRRSTRPRLRTRLRVRRCGPERQHRQQHRRQADSDTRGPDGSSLARRSAGKHNCPPPAPFVHAFAPKNSAVAVECDACRRQRPSTPYEGEQADCKYSPRSVFVAHLIHPCACGRGPAQSLLDKSVARHLPRVGLEPVPALHLTECRSGTRRNYFVVIG